MSASGPLAGLGVVLTRPPAQSRAIAGRLEAAGARVISCPSLAIVPVPPSGESAAALARLSHARLAIFVSANAAELGLAAALAAGPWPAGVAVAAVGEATAAALAGAGLGPVIAPSGRADSEALLALPELQPVRGAPIMIFRGVGGREHLRTVLESRGAQVSYVECYRRERPATDPRATREALGRGEVHAVHAMSAESVENFAMIVGPDADLARVALVVPHEAVARTPARARFGSAIVAGAGPDGLAEALAPLARKA